MSLRDEPDAQGVLRTYFEELDTALAPLPRDRRATLVSEIRRHVDDAMAEQRPSSVAAVHNLLARVGAPEDIAAAALDEEDGPHPRHGRRALLTAAVATLGVVGIGLGVALAMSPGGGTHQAAHDAGRTGSGRHSTGAAQAGSEPPTTLLIPSRPSTTAPTVTTTAPPSTSVGAAHPAAPVSVVASGGSSVLAPATVPPKVPECTEHLQFGADGTAGPLLCPNGAINTLAWRWYATGLGAGTSPFTVMALGPDATPAQVGTAMCADLPTGSIPTVTDAYHLAVAYYGWSFGFDLSQNLVLGVLCPAG